MEGCVVWVRTGTGDLLCRFRPYAAVQGSQVARRKRRDQHQR